MSYVRSIAEATISHVYGIRIRLRFFLIPDSAVLVTL